MFGAIPVKSVVLVAVATTTKVAVSVSPIVWLVGVVSTVTCVATISLPVTPS